MSSPRRFPAHTPDTAQGRAAERLGDLWQRHGGDVSDMVRTMAGSSALLAGYLDLSRSMKRSRLPRRTAEVISIAIQARLGCEQCLRAHVAAGLAAGLDDRDVALAASGTASDESTARLVAYALAVHRDPASVTEQTLFELRASGHRDRELLDVIGLVSLNHLTGALNLVAGLPPEEPMNTSTRLVAYGGILAASLAGAAGLGAAVGPIDTGGTGEHGTVAAHDPAHGAVDDPLLAVRAGTSLDAAGIRIAPDVVAAVAGEPIDYSFRLVDQVGDEFTSFVVRHERPLHLIVASRQLDAFHHLHPEQDATGRWSVELPPLDPGVYRVFADAQPAGEDAVTLGVDLVVHPADTPADRDPTERTVTTGPFEVTLTGDAVAGPSALSFAVTRDGARVGTEPYLGAAGHLVVLRAGDLAYVHAHAEHSDGAISFDVGFPTAGTYRLFLDFAVAGEVHTAAFTVEVPDGTAATPTTPTTPTTDHGGH